MTSEIYKMIKYIHAFIKLFFEYIFILEIFIEWLLLASHCLGQKGKEQQLSPCFHGAMF